jgi:hypothetical protein
MVIPAKKDARKRDARCSKAVRCSCPSLGCVLSEIAGDVSTAELSTALDVSASQNSGPIWKYMGEPLVDVLLANTLATCYLAYATTTRAPIGLFLVYPHRFPPNITDCFPSRRGVTIPAHRYLAAFYRVVGTGSEYWVYTNVFAGSAPSLGPSQQHFRALDALVSTGLEPDEIRANYANEYEHKHSCSVPESGCAKVEPRPAKPARPLSYWPDLKLR